MIDDKHIPVIIDTDPGDDDAASIIWVLANRQFDVKALTIAHGNVGMEKCTINALRVLELCGRADIPVYKGAWKPIVVPARDAAWIHGEDGLGDMGFPLPKGTAAPGYAPAEIARLVRESPQPVTLLALAPLTNIALAILLDPELKNNVKEILFMGGAVKVPGNESPGASFNVAIDPHAAKIVYNSGIPVVQLGLDVCNQVTQTAEDLQTISKAGTPLADFLVRMLAFRITAKKPIFNEKGEKVGEIPASAQADRALGSIGLNDLTTTAYLINPAWFQAQHITMDIEIDGLTPGRTVADFQGLFGRVPNCYFVHKADGKAIAAQWVQDMLAYNP